MGTLYLWFTLQCCMLYILLGFEIFIILFIFYAKKKIEQGLKRETSYESEKGKNIATKEDIEAITEKIETVKNEISYEKQRNHEFVKEREKRLLNILFYAEAVANAVNRLYVYGHNTNDTKRVHDLIDDIAKNALLIRHTSAVCIAAYSDIMKDNKSMTKLVDDIQLLCAELQTKANNVANNITMFKHVFEKTQQENDDTDAFKSAILIGMSNNKLLDTPLQYKDAVNEDINQYVLWLNKLYGEGLAIKYKVETIKDNIANSISHEQSKLSLKLSSEENV